MILKKANISFGLVNIPVIMNPIIKDNDTSFNQIHKKCMRRIKYIKYCPSCKKGLKENEIIKGYQYEPDNYIFFTKEELEKIKPENDKEIEIVSFVDSKEVDPFYFEKSYVLESPNNSKAYLLFCEALKKSKKLAIAKTIISSKFYYCTLRFASFGIIMTTLFFDEEVNIPKEKVKSQFNEKELNLALKLIESLEGKFEPDKYKDEYQNKIMDAIEDKINGKDIKITKKKNKTQINDLMKALEKSLSGK